MKILITGITGLAGSFIAKKMLSEGHEIFGLVREKADLLLLNEIESKIQLINGDILDIPNLEKAIDGKDWVIHCAGLVSFLPKDHENLFKVNTEGTANVVNCCLSANIKKLIFISSVAALGRKEKQINQNDYIQIITEENDWIDSPANSNYAKSKYLAELEVWRGISEGLSAVIVNPSIILGEADWEKSSTRLFKYVFDQNMFYTDGYLNYVDVHDLANLIYKLLVSGISGERYIISASAIEQIDLFKKIAEKFSKTPPKYKLKGLIISILWRLEAIKAKLLGNDPLITKETAETAKRYFKYDNSKIISELNFSFTPLDNTLERVCKKLLEK
jgi:dihydroflavonol-4-reductase